MKSTSLENTENTSLGPFQSNSMYMSTSYDNSIVSVSVPSNTKDTELGTGFKISNVIVVIFHYDYGGSSPIQWSTLYSQLADYTVGKFKVDRTNNEGKIL